MGKAGECLRAGVGAALLTLAAAWPCPAAPNTLSGRVVDEQGRPVAGALVSAWTYALHELTNAATMATQADGDGRFTLTVPLAGARYSLWVRRAGYSSENPSVLAGSAEEIEVKLKSGPQYSLTGVVGDAQTGKGAVGARVLLIGEYGERWEVKADDAGRFSIDRLGDGIAQGVIFAESAGRVSPFRLARGNEKDLSPTVGAPAGLRGRVTDANTAQPIAGAAVTVKPNFMCGFSMSTTTAADGRFAIEGVPPGTYSVDVSHPWYYLPPLRGGWDRLEVPLEAGGHGFVSLGLKRMATIAGQVLGPDEKPVGGALVGTRALWDMSTAAGAYRLVRADAEGRFVISTGRGGEAETVTAAAREGIGRLQPGKLAEGELVENVVIRLPGAMRVRGDVRDRAGAPVPDVWVDGVVQARTDERGRFDLGQVPLREIPQENPVVFRPPRPDRGGVNSWRDDGRRDPMKLPGKDERFFHPRKLLLKPEPGGEAELDVVLEPAPLVTFAGRVLDDAGEPVPGAHVILLSGNADAESLRHELYPFDSMLSGTVVFGPRNVALCRTVAGENGRWTLCVVRETDEGLKLMETGAGDAGCWSIGAEGPRGGTGLVGNITLEEGRTRKELDVRLGEAPKAGRISGRVVDPDGKPLRDILIQSSHPVRRVKTDADGRFTIDGSAREHVTLWFRSEGWSVLSPRPERSATQLDLNDVRGGIDGLEVVLGRNGVLTVAVRRASGKPVCSCEVSAQDARAPVWNSEGKFRMEGCAPGRYRVTVTTPDGVAGEDWVDLKSGGTAVVNIVLPEVEHTITGHVTDAGGAPVANIAVVATGPNFRAKALVDEDGGFTFRVPAGRYRLDSATIHPRFGAAFRPTDVVVGGDAGDARVTLVVTEPRELPR